MKSVSVLLLVVLALVASVAALDVSVDMELEAEAELQWVEPEYAALVESESEMEVQEPGVVSLYDKTIATSCLTSPLMSGRVGACNPITPQKGVSNGEPYLYGLAAIGYKSFKAVCDTTKKTAQVYFFANDACQVGTTSPTTAQYDGQAKAKSQALKIKSGGVCAEVRRIQRNTRPGNFDQSFNPNGPVNLILEEIVAHAKIEC